MKVKLTSSIVWDRKHRQAGDVLDLPNLEALNLIGRGRAIPHDETEKPATNRSVGLKQSDAGQSVTTRKRKTKSGE